MPIVCSPSDLRICSAYINTAFTYSEETFSRTRKISGQSVITMPNATFTRIGAKLATSTSENHSENYLPSYDNHAIEAETRTQENLGIDQHPQLGIPQTTPETQRIKTQNHFKKLQKIEAKIKFYENCQNLIAQFAPTFFIFGAILVMMWLGSSEKSAKEVIVMGRVSLTCGLGMMGVMVVMLIVRSRIGKEKRKLIEFFNK